MAFVKKSEAEITIITKCSILDVATVLDPPLKILRAVIFQIMSKELLSFWTL